MSGQARLKLVDHATGEIRADACPNCAKAELDLELAEKDLRAMRAKLKRFMADAEKARRAYARRDEITEVFEHWREMVGRPRSKLTSDRFDAIRQALEDEYTVDQLKLAVEGIAAYPFVGPAGRSKSGTEQQRHDDVTLACTQGKRIERLANLGYQERKARGV